MIPLFNKTTILQTLVNGFQTPLIKLGKGDVRSPIVFESIYKSFLPIFETLSNFTVA
jgi:hypothetical protein